METITIRPRSKEELAFFRDLLKEANAEAEYHDKKTETLEEKVVRLYQEGHYTDTEVKTFFGIPRKYRVDPFDISPSGDVYWADWRNVEHLDRDREASKEDIEAGRCIEKKPGESFEDFMERIMADESI